MMTTIKAKSLTGKNLTINFGWVTEERVIWADGDKVAVPETRFELDVEVDGVGKVEFPVLGRHENNRAIIGEIVYKGKKHRVVVQIDEETHAAISSVAKQGEEVDAAPVVAARLGICRRCGTYCYGDCETN